MDFTLMPNTSSRRDNLVVTDARLLPQLQLCVNGVATYRWAPVDSLSVDAVAIDTWINRKHTALILDARSGSPCPCVLPVMDESDRIIFVVDRLHSAASRALTSKGYCIINLEEIGNGRLSLLLDKLSTGPEIRSPAPPHPVNAAHLEDRSEHAISTINDTGYCSAAVSLNQIAVEMIKRVDLASLLQHIANKTSTLTNADYSYVALVHESGDYLETIAAANDSQNLKSVRHRPGEGIGGQAWLTGRTVCEPHYQCYAHKLPGLTSAKQACSVPLWLGDRVIGVIGIVYESFHQRIEDQVEVLEMFAPLASVAIDNAKLHEKNRLDLARTEAISSISRSIYLSASFDNVIDHICTTLIETFDANKAHLYRIEDNNTYTPVAAWENVGRKILRTKQADSEIVSQSVASWCIENRRSALIKRGVKDKRESAHVHRLRDQWRLGSTICLPLIHGDKSWGVLFAHRTIDRADFTESDLRQFELIGVQISMALLRRELMDKVEHQAFHDALTGLYNRWRFEFLLASRVEQSNHSGQGFAVLSIDLTGFKFVNDTYGHSVGDQLLQQVATQLSLHVGSEDVLARMGSDEFSLIVSSRSSHDEVMQLARNINLGLSQSPGAGNVRIATGASIGISFYPADAKNADDVLKHAEFAMCRAKNTEGVGIAVFNRTLLIDHENRCQLEADLRNALATNQFELHYQPKVNCTSGMVDGIEALIRWIHPNRGFVSPADFIPVAECCGLIAEIGAWVLDQACRDCVEFQRTHSALTMAINISAHQFNVDEFVPCVFTALERHNLSADSLELEVTESVVMHDIDKVVDKLTQLRCGGVSIAIDDFGTGYSSLQYLAELPLDVLKIDKSFIDRIEDGCDGQALVKTILMMSRELNLKTVAEGVENESQLTILRQLACDYIQGYYYSKPVPAADLCQIVDKIAYTHPSREVA